MLSPSLKLRSKLFIPLMLIGGMFWAYADFVLLPRSERAIEAEYEKELRAHLLSISESLIPFLLEGQLANVYENLDALQEKNKNWHALELRDKHGKTIYPLEIYQDTHLDDRVKIHEQKVGFLSQDMGTLRVHVDYHQVYQQAKSVTDDQRRALFLLLISLLFVYGFILEMIIRRPLVELQIASDELAGGDYETALPKVTGDEVGQLVHSFAYMRDSLRSYHEQLKGEIDDHKSTSAELLEQKEISDYGASHDSLTKLINRSEFERRLKLSIQSCDQSAYGHAMLYLDLDQFKLVNDTSGHIAGDALLRQLVVVLESKIRSSDTLARLGGDEFGLLLNNCSEKVAVRIATNLIEIVRAFRFVWEDKVFSVGVSVGISVINDPTKSITHYLRCADAACYMAKDKGRNRIQLYQEMDKEVVAHQGQMNWANRLSAALENNEFVLYCQSINPINAAAGEIPCYEILIRLCEQDGTITPPGAFIPAAERYNLIVELDLWVIHNTAELLRNISDKVPVKLSVNLSGDSIGDQRISAAITDDFYMQRNSPHQICFEITESAAIINLTAARSFIDSFKVLGYQFSLDDFGSGMSSFGYLKNLPVDYLKIDGGIVRNIAENKTDLVMVKAINEIAKVMEIQTVAEFVEDQAIYDALCDLGVDFAQGYHFGKPSPAREMLLALSESDDLK